MFFLFGQKGKLYYQFEDINIVIESRVYWAQFVFYDKIWQYLQWADISAGKHISGGIFFAENNPGFYRDPFPAEKI